MLLQLQMAMKLSIVSIGYQAILDAYMCLVHLTAGIVRGDSSNVRFHTFANYLTQLPLPEPLFNAFATAAFFKFIVFSIFEMRFMLMIWKAMHPHAFNSGWAVMRRELSLLYTKFCE